MERDDAPILGQIAVKVYGRRWYILALYSFICCWQCALWNTWSPIAQTMKAAYGWSNGVIALLANWGCITYLLLIIPLGWLMKWSMRISMLLCVGLMLFGSAMRCLPIVVDISDYMFLILAHVSAFLIGISEIVTMSAAPAISAIWFPVQERTTATGIAQVANILGNSVSFFVDVELVQDLGNVTTNVTNGEKEEMRHDVMTLMWVMAIPSAVLALLVLLYFPTNPKYPPSRSSGEERLSFSEGVLSLLKNWNAWLIALIISLPAGTIGAWLSLLVEILPSFCFDDGDCLTQEWVSWLAIVTNLASCGCALVISYFTDVFRGRIRGTVLILFAVGTVVFSFLTLVTMEIFVFSSMSTTKAAIYILLVVGTTLSTGVIPLCTELAVEICYPTAEVVVGGWLSVWINFISMIYYCILDIPDIGVNWLNFTLPLSMLVSLLLMFFVNPEYNRSRVDEVGDAILGTLIQNQFEEDDPNQFNKAKLRLQSDE